MGVTTGLEFYENFGTLLSIVSDSVIIVDHGGVILDANGPSSKYLQISLNDIIGKRIQDLNILNRETIALATSLIDKRLKGEKIEAVDLPLEIGGKTYFVEPRGNKIKYFGKLADIVILHDVTERKLKQAQLIKQINDSDKDRREFESKYQHLFQESLDAIFITEIETGTIVDCNKAAEVLVGRSRPEIIGQHQTIIHPKSVLEDITREFREHAVDPDKIIETQIITKSGEIKQASIKAKILEFRGKKCLQRIFKDATETVKIQQAFVESETRFRQLVELAQEGIWLFDNDYRTVFVNPRMAQMLGYKEYEMKGRLLYDFLKDKDKKLAQERSSKLGLDCTPFIEYCFSKKDGTSIFTRIVSSLVKDDNGIMIGTLAVISDITESKRAEIALRASEERARTIVEHSPIGIATFGRNKLFLTANKTYCKILGYSEEEIKKMTFKDLIFQENLEDYSRKMRALESGKLEVFSHEKRYRRKDGKVIECRAHVSAVKNGRKKPSLFIVEMEDISEQKIWEQELVQEKSKLESVTQSIGAGLVTVNRDYRIEFANKFIKEQSGEIAGTLCYKSLNSLDQPCPNCGVKRVFGKEVAFDSHEHSSVDAKGRPCYIEVITTPIKDANENVVSAVEALIDITEKKWLQQELSEYSQGLEKLVEKRTQQLKDKEDQLVKTERLAAIGELAGMVGHDLRNPLSGVKNAAYYLKKNNATLDRTSMEMIDVIDDCVEYSNKIINDLLDYSRDVYLELEECSPKELVYETLAVLSVPTSITVVNKLPTEPLIVVDRSKIERVFENLIKNAVDAMPKGGNITIDSCLVGDSMHFHFADTGAGIPDDVLPKIFLPLFTTKAKGMGFGLAICKRMVEAHNGTITVQTSKEKGTIFTVELPRMRNRAAQNRIGCR